jgi:hypothetical protein
MALRAPSTVEVTMGSRHAVSVALLIPIAAAIPALFGQNSRVFETCSPVLETEVCTWVTLDGDVVVDLGATVPIALVESVPTDVEMVWPPEPLGTIPLPAPARTALGIDHLGINWEAHGHPPGPFMAPHFDFHFYSITTEEVRSIDCSDERKPATLPSGHTLPDIDIPGMGVLVGLCVPHMGMHAMTDDLIEGAKPFEASLVLGYYGGTPTFFEPMVSRDRLLEKTDFELDVPAIDGLPAGVRYPSRFRAEYDAGKDHYRMIFTGFSN